MTNRRTDKNIVYVVLLTINNLRSASVERIFLFWRADEQTSGQTDEQTSGQTDKRTNGQADKQTSGQTDKQTSRRADKQTSRQADKRKFWERVRFVVFGSLSFSSSRRFVVFVVFVVFVEKKTQNNLLRDQIFTIFVKRIYYGQQQVIEDKLEHQLPKIAMLQEECNNLRPNIPLLHTLYQPQR